ncbi:hypothetical protein Tco_0465024 [Tanacetum coccineum]
MVTAISNVYKFLGCSHLFYISLTESLMASLNEDDKTGLNLLKLLDGEKASQGKKTLGHGPHVSSNPVFHQNGALSTILFPIWAEGKMEHENQFGVEQAYGHPSDQQDLKAKCDFAFLSYNSTLLDLNKSKQHEVYLSNMFSKVYKEKTELTEDLGWVLKKGIPQSLKSDEF